MAASAGDPPTVALSFANNFWGREDAGVQPMLDRMHSSKTTCDELKSFYNARASLEDDYARKLLALCRKPLGSSESGTLRASLDVMRGEVETMGKAHLAIAGQMKSELDEPLAAFAGGMKERRKIVQGGIEKLYKTKLQQTQAVNRSRDRYESDCLKIKGYLAQGHMVMGQEERKNKAKMEKTQIQLATTSNEYEASIKALEETTGRWNRDWKIACDKFQDLEEERLDFTKSSLWTFANIASTVCVTDDAACEKIRLSLENCEVEKDIVAFIKEKGTGQEIPDAPKYINFCRGDMDDNVSTMSGEEAYSVAQFERNGNPAYRSSSPQPPAGQALPSSMPDVSSQLSQMSIHKEASTHAGASAFPHHPDDIVQVPHNEYPENGMTMFCRKEPPPSERSSAASPQRSSSRETHSDYSNPTSYSSIDPVSARQSPTKMDRREHGSASPTKDVQKRRSGFFSNSPFRRKSKHEREAPNLTTPKAGNNWSEATERHGPQVKMSPPKYGNQSQNRSYSPEPVDPRADFQLNVGSNIFDVACPETRGGKSPARRGLNPAVARELDPIAAALEELKGVNKQSLTRVSADHYAGVASPVPGSVASTQASESQASRRSDPPPSYNDPPITHLGAPKPAFTSAQMQQTTRKYVANRQEVYGGMRATSPRPPREVSPRPMRSTSPRPGYYDGRENRGLPRSASPNPYGSASSTSRSRDAQMQIHSQQQRQQHTPTRQYTSNHNSPNELVRAHSPSPQYMQQDRPNSRDNMVLYSGPADFSRGRNAPQSQGRPVSYYAGQNRGPAQTTAGAHVPDGSNRIRSKSVADGRKYTADGRPILQFARAIYLYRAAIPEELSFAKGDMLAILRYQDDGWWEAEVAGKQGRRGLIPSNYVQQ